MYLIYENIEWIKKKKKLFETNRDRQHDENKTTVDTLDNTVYSFIYVHYHFLANKLRESCSAVVRSFVVDERY